MLFREVDRDLSLFINLFPIFWANDSAFTMKKQRLDNSRPLWECLSRKG